MSARAKNPLYVVKGDNVEQASNVFDMLLKKFNLEPVFNFLMQIVKMLLENVKSYTAIVIINDLFENFIQRLEFFKKFSAI